MKVAMIRTSKLEMTKESKTLRLKGFAVHCLAEPTYELLGKPNRYSR